MAPDASVKDARESPALAAEGAGQKPSGGRVRRMLGWAKQHRLIAALLVVSTLTSIGAGIGLYGVFHGGQGASGITVSQALQALDEGRLGDARKIATLLKSSPQLSAEQLGGPAFVLGAVTAYEAEQTRNPECKELSLVASRWLEEARDRGFPEGREGEGLWLLGRSLYLSGQIAASRPVLREALAANPNQQPEIHYLLADAYLNDANPKYDDALAENTFYLASKELLVAQRQQGLLQRAKLLLALERLPECKETLAKIPADTKGRAEATLLSGQILLHEATRMGDAAHGGRAAQDAAATGEARQKIEAAIAAFRQAETQDTLSSQVGGRAMYLVGISLLRLKDYRAALGQFARLSKVHPDTPEALAATLQEADLARRLGKDSDAVARYRQVLSRLRDPESFSNPWISWDGLRKQALEVYQQYMSSEKFVQASQLVSVLYPLVPRKQQMELTARTYRTWGESLVSQSKALPPSKSDAVSMRGHEQLRRAGWQYLQIAQLHVADREYPDNLWDAANCYLEGHDFRSAAIQFQQYLKSESRRRHAVALVLLAEARLACDQLDEALAACLECTDLHPRDPSAYRARLLGAHAYVAKGEMEKAKKLLQENLNGESLTPASKEWQESLFELGKLLHRQQAYEEAVDRLHEAIQRYPNVPRSIEAQYLIADSYRLRARQLEEKLKEDRVENTRVARSRKVRELLTLALGEYRELLEKLGRRQETDELAPLERLALRNCYFSIGNLLFQLQQYEDAIKAYVMATNRYRSNPEVLDAYVQMARAYRKLNKPAEARGALEQAKMALSRIKADVPFKETTNYSREEWTKLLDKMAAS